MIQKLRDKFGMYDITVLFITNPINWYFPKFERNNWYWSACFGPFCITGYKR